MRLEAAGLDEALDRPRIRPVVLQRHVAEGVDEDDRRDERGQSEPQKAVSPHDRAPVHHAAEQGHRARGRGLGVRG